MVLPGKAAPGGKKAKKKKSASDRTVQIGPMAVKTLGLENEEEAAALLTRVANQAMPIMTRHSWVVHKLEEFQPKSNGLLGMNVNRGRKIMIRLRPPGSTTTFYPWNHVLGTMLHELVHMKIGPHSSAFYKLLEALWEEAEKDMDAGVSGAEGARGFASAGEGKSLRSDSARAAGTSKRDKRSAMAAAAKRRARNAELMGSGTTGGGGGRSGSSAAPDRSRSRLLRIGLGMSPSPLKTKSRARTGRSSGGGGGEAIAAGGCAAIEAGVRVTDLTGGDGSSATSASSSSVTAASSSASASASASSSSSASTAAAAPAHRKRGRSAVWACALCTLQNTAGSRRCAACGSDRAGSSAAAAATPIDENWTCSRCTFANDELALCCRACGDERGSVANTAFRTELSAALASLRSLSSAAARAAAARAAQLLRRIFANIAANPHSEHFLCLRVASRVFARDLVPVPEAVHALEVAGFRRSGGAAVDAVNADAYRLASPLESDAAAIAVTKANFRWAAQAAEAAAVALALISSGGGGGGSEQSPPEVIEII